MNKRIGIFSGTFNPVHSGHIAFALQAIAAANLDKVYFLPERRPRTKQSVEHYAHRVAMLRQAIKPHPQFRIIEFVDINFTIDRTLPKIKALFPGDELVILAGSDLAKSIPKWPNVDRLLASTEFVIGLRGPHNARDIESQIKSWPAYPKTKYIIDSYAPSISSSTVRQALRRRSTTSGILRSVEKYSNKHWLYISIA